MRRYFKTLKSPSDPQVRARRREGIRDFAAALLLLGAAFCLSLQSERAVSRGERALGIVYAVTALGLAAITAVAMVPRLARRVEFKRWLMPMSFGITREGAIFILGLFLLSLATINTGNNLLFMILSALLSAIVTSGIFARSSLRSIQVSMDVPENVFVGERVSIKVSLKNKKRCFPSVSITVEDLGQAERVSTGTRRNRIWFRKDKTPCEAGDSGRKLMQHSAYFPFIAPGETRTELVSRIFPRRGRYVLTGFRLTTCFPFAFFRRGERMRATGEVLVYPPVQEVSSFFHLLPFQPGRVEGRHAGSGDTLWAMRRYQEGENARLVDWKATAKTGDLMARQFAREEESRFSLILDTVIHPAVASDYVDRFEKAVSLAASIASHFSEEGADFEFLTPEEFVSRGTGAGHLYRILRSLATVESRPPSDLSLVDLRTSLSGVVTAPSLQETLSEKTFKIIITSKPRGSFPSAVWRSSHVIYFDEL